MAAKGARRVVVLGGGALGSATALALARGGASVTLLSVGEHAAGASGRSLSWLNSAAPTSSGYHRLRMAGIDRYRELYQSRRPSWLRFDGGLRWVASSQAKRLHEMYRHQQAVGYPAEWLSADDVARRVPGVNPAAVPAEGAVLNPDEGWVDLPCLISELHSELHSLGGEIDFIESRARLVLQAERVAGVRVGERVLPADAVVLATGADVPRDLAELGISVPDGTTPGLLVQVRPAESSLRAVLHTPRVAMRPAPNGGLVMDAGWSESEVEVRPDGSFRVAASTVEGLVAEASRVLDVGADGLRLQSYGVGWKPIPGDGFPVLGRVQEVDGLHVAFSHSGATLALIVGELVADEVLQGASNAELDPFRPDRFARS